MAERGSLMAFKRAKKREAVLALREKQGVPRDMHPVTYRLLKKIAKKNIKLER